MDDPSCLLSENEKSGPHGPVDRVRRFLRFHHSDLFLKQQPRRSKPRSNLPTPHRNDLHLHQFHPIRSAHPEMIFSRPSHHFLDGHNRLQIRRFRHLGLLPGGNHRDVDLFCRKNAQIGVYSESVLPVEAGAQIGRGDLVEKDHRPDPGGHNFDWLRV